MLKRIHVHQTLADLYANPEALSQQVSETATCPDDVTAWLGRLMLLYGVPINYLVPDENMLPPESIRFFYLDCNWTDALLDGAFSLGRNLTVNDETVSLAIDRAVRPSMAQWTGKASAAIRPAALGVDSPEVTFKTISGFLLRSSLVQAYPGMGVNPYPQGGTPLDPNPTLLNILRMERLGQDSDTLICLVEGDMFRVDIHEAPEALHYGLDSFTITGGTISSKKTIYTFTKNKNPDNPSDYSVTMDMDHPKQLDLATNQCFRANNDPRTVKMQTLANLIAQNQIPPLSSIDSSEMGFEMVEGVGMVSFYQSKA